MPLWQSRALTGSERERWDYSIRASHCAPAPPLRRTGHPRLPPRPLGRPGPRLPAAAMRRHPRLGRRGRERGAAAALCEPAPSRTPRLLMSPGSWIAAGAPRTPRTARRAASAGCTRRGPGAPAPTPPSPPPHRPPPYSSRARPPRDGNAFPRDPRDSRDSRPRGHARRAQTKMLRR